MPNAGLDARSSAPARLRRDVGVGAAILARPRRAARSTAASADAPHGVHELDLDAKAARAADAARPGRASATCATSTASGLEGVVGIGVSGPAWITVRGADAAGIAHAAGPHAAAAIAAIPAHILVRGVSTTTAAA